MNDQIINNLMVYLFRKKIKKEITYDIVSNPSHAKARVLEFLPENFSGSDGDMQMPVICESVQSDILYLEQDGINISSINEFVEKSFVKSIIEEDFAKAINDLKFKF